LSFLLYLMRPGLRSKEFTYHGLMSTHFVWAILGSPKNSVDYHHKGHTITATV